MSTALLVFKDVQVKLSTRPEKRIGTDEMWHRAEQALAEALEANGIAFDLQPVKVLSMALKLNLLYMIA
jgi:threonyl-tRNA synthetase